MNYNKLDYPHIAIEDSNLSLEAFNEKYLDTHTPVLIKGGAKNWSAYKKWDIEYLSKAAGDYPVELRSQVDMLEGYDYDGKRPNLQNLSAYLQALKNGDQNLQYARQSRILLKVPSLLNDIETPIYIQEPSKQNAPIYIARGRDHSVIPMTWFGPAGTLSESHWDPEHNIFAQIKGTKRFILIPSKDTEYCYPDQYRLKDIAYGSIPSLNLIREVKSVKLALRYLTYPQIILTLKKALKASRDEESYPAEFKGKIQKLLWQLKNSYSSKKNIQPNKKRFKQILHDSLSDKELLILSDIIVQTHNYEIDLENPDLEKYPNFRKAHPFQAIVEAGDILYVPLQWIHTVRSFSVSFSLNWFFSPSLNEKINPRHIILKTTLSHMSV